jgi:glycerol-3-phosphate O-acyltransferase
MFYDNGLLPPHIAAGINLAFWPFGPIARWTGGYFIRRSFKGDHLYAAVLRAYVKRLIRDRFPQEFFIEGGRSRTGKLVFPKTGLLAMEVEAWRDSTIDDVFFVPVAIDYEKLPEGRSYANELGGGEKRKESFWSLLRARKLLRGRHGRLYIQFNQPISLRALSDELRPGEDEGARRAFVQGLANRIAYGISRASTITPVGLCAVALLAGPDEITGAAVTSRIAVLRQLAARDGGRLSARLAAPAGATPETARAPARQDDAIAEALGMLIRDGVVQTRPPGAGTTVYAVPPQRRAELDFYRNNVIHHFIAYAIIAAAIRARPPAGASAGVGVAARREDVERDARWLSRLLKLEFIYRVGAPFEAIFSETFASMSRLGIAGGDRDSGVAFLARMVRPFLDAYRSATATLAGWSGGDQKAFVAAALERARDDAAAGRTLPEAVSRATLDNAVAWLIAEGAFLPAPEAGDRVLLVAPRWRGHDGRALIAAIDRFRD